MRQRKQDLLLVAQMALQDLYEMMEPRRCAFLLTDESGCLLLRIGHYQTLSELDGLGLREGAFFSEGRLGCNAINLAMLEGMALALAGIQHFKLQLHDWHCCASPVYNRHARQVAIMALISRGQDAGVGDLALTVSASRELAHLLEVDALMQESSHHLNTLYGLLDGVDDGVLLWDQQGSLRYLNQLAANKLQLDASLSLGQPLRQYIGLPQRVQWAINQGASFARFDTTLECPAGLIDVQLSLKPIASPLGLSFIALLHPVASLPLSQDWRLR